MARPIWSGILSFGLVSVPVSLYAATENHTVAFRQIQRGTSDRVRNKRVNERTGEEVAFSELRPEISRSSSFTWHPSSVESSRLGPNALKFDP